MSPLLITCNLLVDTKRTYQPSSMVSHFSHLSFFRMLNEKREKIAGDANKLRSGLSKIDTTRAAVEVMSIELEVAKMKVMEIQIQCDEYMAIIKHQTAEAEEQQEQVTADSIKIGEEEKVCLKLAATAQADLDLAMPALEEAIRALDALNKKDIAEVRSYAKPPQKVEMVLEAVMILKRLPPNWAEAKRFFFYSPPKEFSF